MDQEDPCHIYFDGQHTATLMKEYEIILLGISRNHPEFEEASDQGSGCVISL